LGIDFGTEFFKVSMIAPGKTFVIIENETTKRKTNTAVLPLSRYLSPKKQEFTSKTPMKSDPSSLKKLL
jgi:hypothetical protein